MKPIEETDEFKELTIELISMVASEASPRVVEQFRNELLENAISKEVVRKAIDACKSPMDYETAKEEIKKKLPKGLEINEEKVKQFVDWINIYAFNGILNLLKKELGL